MIISSSSKAFLYWGSQGGHQITFDTTSFLDFLSLLGPQNRPVLGCLQYAKMEEDVVGGEEAETIFTQVECSGLQWLSQHCKKEPQDRSFDQ